MASAACEETGNNNEYAFSSGSECRRVMKSICRCWLSAVGANLKNNNILKRERSREKKWLEWVRVKRGLYSVQETFSILAFSI